VSKSVGSNSSNLPGGISGRGLLGGSGGTWSILRRISSSEEPNSKVSCTRSMVCHVLLLRYGGEANGAGDGGVGGLHHGNGGRDG